MSDQGIVVARGDVTTETNKERPMFSTIVIGVDGRAGGRDALALGAALRGAEPAQLLAVQAYPYEYFVSRGGNADFEAVLRQDVERELTAELERAEIVARTSVVPDSSPARALHRAAEHADAGLIVVGSSHRGRVGRVLAGDVAASTLHGSPCPVAVAPAGFANRAGGLERIGVGFDGSPESRAAVELAHRLAQDAGARLHVMCVLEPALPWAAYPSSVHDWSGEVEIVRERSQQHLDELVSELGPGVSGELLEGEPVRELLFEANELDLLVCGSRSYGPARRLLLGSTSSRVVREAPFPVMVLPRGVAMTEAPGAEAPVAAAEE